MNFKDRLNLIKTTNSFFIQNSDYIEVKNESDIADIFANDSEVVKIIKNQMFLSKNIIIASSVDCDKTITAQYIKNIIPYGESVEVIYDISKDIQFINANKIIVPEVSIADFVKILEYIMYGYKGFILGINIKSNNNILETLKSLILLYFPNFNNNNVINLLGLSDSVIVYINKNSDGIFYISDIGELKINDGELKLQSLYSIDCKNEEQSSQNYPKEIPFEVYTAEPQSDIEVSDEQNFEEEVIESENQVNDEAFETVTLTDDSEESEIIKEELVETETETVSPSFEPSFDVLVDDNQTETVEASIDNEVNTESIKKNKYKLLKEKVRNKKINNSQD